MLKSRSASWRAISEEALGKDGLGYTSTSADKDIWVNMDILLYGKEYYSMVLVYVDDILCIHKDTSVIIDALESIYVMKQRSMGPLDRYLEANIENMKVQDGKVMWATHSRDYC